MQRIDLAFFWGFVLGAGAMWLLCSSGLLVGRRQSAAEDGAGAEQESDGEYEQGGLTAKREAVTVEGLAAALRHVGSSSDRVTVLENRLGEIRGPLTGGDVITLLEPVPNSTDRMTVLKRLMRRVRGTVPDNEYAEIMSMLSSGDAAEASKLLRR